MTRLISVVCAAFLLSLTTPAVAQSKAKTPKAAKAKKAKKAKKATPVKGKKAKAMRCKKGQVRTADGGCARDLDFKKGDEIGGDRPIGYGDRITATGYLYFGGLIRIRSDFHQEILKSAEDL